MNVRVGPRRKLSTEELMLLNCGVGENSWESLDCKEIKPVNPKGNQCWIFIGKTDAEAKTPILWPPDEKNWLIGKDPDAGKDWRQEEKGTAEDEMVGWHHRLNGHEFQQALGDGEGQGNLVCCSPGVIKSRTRLSDWPTVTESRGDWGPRGTHSLRCRELGPQITAWKVTMWERSHYYLKPLMFGFYFVNCVLPLLMQNTPISITMRVKFLTLLKPLFTHEQIPAHHQVSCVSTVCWMGSIPHQTSHLRGRARRLQLLHSPCA